MIKVTNRPYHVGIEMSGVNFYHQKVVVYVINNN
jgi:hypothetical protein